jgi:hypothetical protein
VPLAAEDCFPEDYRSASGRRRPHTVINGFPKEGIYLQALGAKLVISDSQIRNNGVGVYGWQSASGVVSEEYHGIYADRVRVEGSTICGVIVGSGVWARFVNT